MSILERKPGSGILLALAAFLGAVGVAAGAFGAHFLHDMLEASGRTEVWKTAVFYNLVHVVAVVAVASRSTKPGVAPWLWLFGLTLFSGSLYILALGGPLWIGPITPIGGTLLMIGWVWFGISALGPKGGGGS